MCDANEDMSLHDKFLRGSGMKSARSALVGQYSWFLHVSEKRFFEEIKTSGIVLRNPGCAAPSLVIERLGDNADKIICLRPQGTFDTTPNRDQLRFLMALAAEELPATIGLDWSFGGVWKLAEIIKCDSPALTEDEVFCEVVRRRGSVLSYEALAPSSLRVWVKDAQQDDPSAWPNLSEVRIDELRVF